jgi:hypothetical protein
LIEHVALLLESSSNDEAGVPNVQLEAASLAGSIAKVEIMLFVFSLIE